PGPTAARLGAGIRAAARILADSASRRGEILLVSDFQRAGAAGLEGLTLPPGAAVRPVPIGPADRANAAVVGVETFRRPGDGGVEVTARVAWFGGAPKPTRLTLELAGRPVATLNATLQPNTVTPVRFVAPRVPPGTVRGALKLPADALPADDEFRFALAGDDLIRVRLLAPADARAEELLFIERALTIGRPPRFTVEVRRGGPPSLEGLGRGTAVVFLDRLPSGEAERRGFAGFLDRGGGALVLAGSRLPTRSAAPGPEDPWPAAVGETITRTATPAVLGALDRDHPAIAPLRGLEGGGFAGARFFRYRALLPRADADVLVRLDDGRPALIATSAADRRIVMLAAPTDGVWSDFALHPFFLPLLQRLVEHAAGRGTERAWREVGDVLALDRQRRGLRVFSPAGQILRPEGDSAAAAVPLREAGFYELRRDAASAEPAALVAVNPPAAESDPARMDPREILLAARVDSAAARAADELTVSPVAAERRQRIWRLVLFAALVVLAIEVAYANLGPGRRAPGAVPT
ncbi:MAG: hypothetical protein ACRENB_14500, partial [Gemmatimonadales bacterium]